MKLIYISQSTFFSSSANSIHVFNMCNAFAEQINTLCISYHRNGSFEDFYGKKKIFNSVFIKKLNFPFSELIQSFFRLYIVISNYNQNDIIFSRCLYTSFLLCLFTNKKFIYETHSIKRSILLRRIELIVVSSNNCKKVVLITKSLCDYFSSIQDKIIYYHDCTTIINNNIGYKFDITYTGSFNPGKGLELIHKLGKKHQGIRLSVFGGSISDYVSCVKEKPPKNISVLGRLSYKECRIVQQASKILILPNQEDVFVDSGRTNIGNTTSPLKLFEYLSTGNVVLTHKISSYFNEVKGVTIPVEYNDIEDWHEKIRMVLDDLDFYKNEIGLKAKDLILKKYTWNRRAEFILSNS